MKAFRVKGKFLMGDRWQEFSKEVVGSDEEAVKMEVYSILGSKHRVKRPKINILEVTSIPEDDITDPIARFTIQDSKKKKAGPEKGAKSKKDARGTKGKKGAKTAKARKRSKGETNG